MKMKAVILAAGQSTRTYPLTLTRPKPLLKAGSKTLLEHNLDALLPFVDEVIIVVGYKKEMIQTHLGKKYKDCKITYVEQKEQKGTGHALLLTEEHIEDSFFLLMGDDVYTKDDMNKCNNHELAILTKEIEDPSNFGVVVEKNHNLSHFVEKPKTFVSNLANTAFYKLNKNIFPHLKNIEESERGEIELPDALLALSREHPIRVVKTKHWLPVGFPWDLLRVDKILRKKENLIGENTVIEGEVTNSNIGNNCTIKGIVKNSIVMANSVVEAGSIVENSVLGENVTFSGKAKSKANALSVVKGKQIKVGKIGAIIGDNVKANNVKLKSGVKIWPNQEVKGEIKEDVAE